MPRRSYNRRYRPTMRIPPLPKFIILTDKDDGTEWLLTHSDDDVDGVDLHISINDAGLSGVSTLESPNVIRYPANEGPLVGHGLRLFVRDGRLGLETTDTVGYAPVFTRVGVERESHELRVVWGEGDDLGLAFVEESPIE